MKLLDHLTQDPVFSKLCLEDRKRMVDRANRCEYQEGEFIAHYGQTWSHPFIVMKGEVNILKLSPEGRTLGALRLGIGEVFWSPALFDEGPSPASLEVKEACTIYTWQREDLLPIIKSNIEVMWQICLLMSDRIRKASNFLEELVFQPVNGRVAKLLLSKFKEGDNPEMPREMTLDEMSAMIGTTPVMVCKILSQFAAEGLIKVSRTQFTMLDRQGLEALTSS